VGRRNHPRFWLLATNANRQLKVRSESNVYRAGLSIRWFWNHFRPEVSSCAECDHTRKPVGRRAPHLEVRCRTCVVVEMPGCPARYKCSLGRPFRNHVFQVDACVSVPEPGCETGMSFENESTGHESESRPGNEASTGIKQTSSLWHFRSTEPGTAFINRSQDVPFHVPCGSAPRDALACVGPRASLPLERDAQVGPKYF
jgi:hypothetical protein